MKKERAENNVIIIEIEKEFINTSGKKLLTPSKRICLCYFSGKTWKWLLKIKDFLGNVYRQPFDHSQQQIISWATMVFRHRLSGRFGKLGDLL